MSGAQWNIVTWALIASAWAGFIGWDVFLAMKGAATESMLIRDFGKVCTFWPHLWGFLMGHWFVPRLSQWQSGWMWGLGFWGVLLVWDIAWGLWVKTYPWYRYEGLWLLIGVACGTLFWGQTDGNSPLP